ncbi:hypothetical protein U9M48_005440, partial [Paspalum notatum var. saurae]
MLSILVQLMGMKDLFLSFSSFKVQNDHCVRFWEDSWKGNKLFMELFPNLHRIVRKKCTVANVPFLNISFRKALTGDNLKSWFELVLKVANVSLVERTDKFRRDLNKGGPTRVILTKDNLAKRKWNGNTSGYFCSAGETIKHLFFDCHMAKSIWNTLFLTIRIKPPNNLYVRLFGYVRTMWVIYRGTYWLRSWSPLCNKEERGQLKMGCNK